MHVNDWRQSSQSADKNSTRDVATRGQPIRSSERVPQHSRSQRQQTPPRLVTNLPAAECKTQRERLGWSVQELSSRSGFPVATLIEFEGGRRTLGLSAQVALRRALRKGTATIRA